MFFVNRHISIELHLSLKSITSETDAKIDLFGRTKESCH